MCPRFEELIAWEAYCKAMQMVEWGVTTEQSDLDLPPIEAVNITDQAPIIRIAAAGGVELASMRWSWPSPNRKPVFNYVSENRHFGQSRRCLIPASAYFEFTGEKSPKTKHRFTMKGAAMLCMAGIWRPAEGNFPDAFTMLTTSAGPDVAPLKGRQPVVLRMEDWRPWIELSKPEAELLHPLPAGSLDVETVGQNQ